MSIDRLFFDPTDNDTIEASSNVGAFVRSQSGAIIDSKTIASEDWLNVAAALHDGNGVAITSTSGALDVNIKSGIELSVDLIHTDDSIRLGDGTNFLTSTTEGSKIGLDVNLINPSVNVNSASNGSIVNSNASVNTTAASLVTAAANRAEMLIYHNGNKTIYLGGSGVTTTNGFPLSPRSYLSLAIGPAIDLYAIAANGTQDIRILEITK